MINPMKPQPIAEALPGIPPDRVVESYRSRKLEAVAVKRNSSAPQLTSCPQPIRELRQLPPSRAARDRGAVTTCYR